MQKFVLRLAILSLAILMSLTGACYLSRGSVASAQSAGFIWVEGEKPVRSTMTRHPWWYDHVKKDMLSGGDFITNWGDKPGEAEYSVTAPSAGDYEFWVRANPVATRLSYRINQGGWLPIELDKSQTGSANIAEDGKIDLRFIAWAKAGKVTLNAGTNSITFRMDSANNNHGALDCFVLSKQPFTPRGILKPGDSAPVTLSEGDKGWFPFSPKSDTFAPGSLIDLRYLNEKEAGDGGFIGAKGSQFIHSKTGEPIRFWAVNGPPGELKDRDSIRRAGRLLAKYGVNMVRVHGGYFDARGDVSLSAVQHAQDIVESMKLEGIYSHFSIYFPLWSQPKADNPYLKGYDGTKNPFAALYFDPAFQKQYREWWKALLLTPSKTTNKRLIDEPAVSSLELVNEDSYFFWTFADANIPDAEMRIVESQFGKWAANRYGSLDSAKQKWGGQTAARDNIAEGRLGFRPLWNISHERSQRDQDTARFLLESQRGFYKQTIAFLRELGFKGVITCSNWSTASPEYFGPLEKYSYTVGDFIDRHGYFDAIPEGNDSGWSIREGHTYTDRSALRFDPAESGKPKVFVHPSMDPSYDDKPSMISEVAWSRPNRYRTEAPIYLAAYGALQDSDAIVHFAFDGAEWSSKPGYFVQPWTLATPTQMGQFPVAALLFRKGLISPGDTLVNLNLKVEDILSLRGTPLPQDASFDELRLKDLPPGASTTSTGVIDPLVHYAGRTNVTFSDSGGTAKIGGLSKYIDHAAQTVTSTTGQLRLDYRRGTLTVNAPQVQGVVGSLDDAGTMGLGDMEIQSALDLGSIFLVSLDGKPLSSSSSMLLEVMSEEKPSGFKTEPIGNGRKKILSLGQDPWMVKELTGTVRLKRADAGMLKVTALDLNGYPSTELGSASKLTLKPTVVYYHIHK